MIGGSVYAFTITLASFLAGIGLGSLMYTRFLAHAGKGKGQALMQQRMMQAAVLALLIGLCILLGLPVIGQLPALFLKGFAVTFSVHFGLFQLFVFALSFMIMFLPTLFMGALFPLVAVIWTTSGAAAGRGVGTAYAINTVGTIFGALIGGLLILPWLGVHKSIQLSAGMYLLVAFAFWLSVGARKNLTAKIWPPLLSAALFLVIALQIPAWDKLLMSRGVYYRAHITSEQMHERSLADIIADAELLYYEEGLDGTVTVKREGGDRYLAVNSKTDASSRGDLPTQILLGQLPLQVNRHVRQAMIIGLGSGITAGTVAANDSIESLTVLEISTEVVEASDFFLQENYAVLSDPRVRLVTADARNFLLATHDRYDLIVSEVSNPWISGISNLFTWEFFALAKSRLNPGGVMSQWFHTYSMSEPDFRTVLRTFADQFRFVSVWRTLPGDLVLMGSDEPHDLSLGQVDWHAVADTNATELRRAGVYNDRDLVRHYIIGGEALRQFVSGAVRNSDKHPVIEFNAPRNLYAATDISNLYSVFSFLGGQNIEIPVQGLYHLAGNRIEATAFGLSIAALETGKPTGLHARWLANWQLQGADDDRAYKLASARVLTWKEGRSEYYIQASDHSEAMSETMLKTLLITLVAAHEPQWGEVMLPGGSKAVWLHVKNQQNQRVQLAITWNCKNDLSGFNRYAFVASLLDPGRDNWNLAVTDQVKRFHCP